MTRKTWIMLKRGILDPKHREMIGIRIWLYLHMLDRANWVQGAVLEWRDESEAEEMQMDLSTLRGQRRQLEADGYIRCERRGHDQRVTIIKWVNPREYTGKVYNPPDVAGTAQEPSVENLTLVESSAAASDSQSDSQSVRFLTPLPLDSHITYHMKTGGRAPAAPQTLWVQVLGQLQRQFRKSDFETWVRDTQVVSQTDDEIIVGTANPYAMSWLQDHAKEPAEAALEKMAGRPMSLMFVVLERATA
jgi:hypothetical protein